jgi:hypothetical protein
MTQSLMLEYITTDLLTEPPSVRLRDLGLLADSRVLTSESQYSSFLHKHVQAIFNKEIGHWLPHAEISPFPEQMSRDCES